MKNPYENCMKQREIKKQKNDKNLTKKQKPTTKK